VEKEQKDSIIDVDFSGIRGSIVKDLNIHEEVKIAEIRVRCPYWLWNLSRYQTTGYVLLFPWGYNGQDMKQTTRVHTVPRLRMCGAVPPHPLHLYSMVLNYAQGQL
jgi:hypothetical protein